MTQHAHIPGFVRFNDRLSIAIHAIESVTEITTNEAQPHCRLRTISGSHDLKGTHDELMAEIMRVLSV